MSKLKTGVLISSNFNIAKNYDNYLFANIATSLIEQGNIFSNKNYQLFKMLELALQRIDKEINPFMTMGTMNEKNVCKDYFHDRIIFPIKDEQENVIGFSARTISGQDPKYINSKENLIFHKQELAYNIHKSFAKTARPMQEIIVLEGFMDVISLNRIGITNCIAIMGTALSDYHIELFKKLKTKVNYFLDDWTWLELFATLKAATKLINAKVDVEIIDNKFGLDPDELINQDKTNT
ncbi:hypothetical protein FQA39_LY12876 [Lamprigera yunnana]|nr:hypothetical protein FQA39_LY12876 [Lamprigera yunnana]